MTPFEYEPPIPSSPVAKLGPGPCPSTFRLPSNSRNLSHHHVNNSLTSNSTLVLCNSFNYWCPSINWRCPSNSEYLLPRGSNISAKPSSQHFGLIETSMVNDWYRPTVWAMCLFWVYQDGANDLLKAAKCIVSAGAMWLLCINLCGVFIEIVNWHRSLCSTDT